MAKKRRKSLVVDYDDYQEPEFYDGDPPNPGVYEFELVDVDLEYEAASSGAEGFKWTFQCREEPYAGWRGYMYSNLDPSSTKQKTQQILKAIRSGKKTKIDLGKYIGKEDGLIKLAKPVLGRVKSEYYNDEYSPKLSFVMELDETARRRRKSRKVVEDDDEEEDEDELEETEEVEDEEFEETESEDDEDEDEDEDSDDEEEEEPPPPPRRAKKAVAKKVTGKKRKSF